MQDEHEGQLRWGHAGASVAGMIQGSKIIVFEQVALSGNGELVMKALGVHLQGPDIAHVEEGIVGGTFTDHIRNLPKQGGCL